DAIALLSATLRTYQKAVCDSEQVNITCPRGTSISIEFAQYNNFVAKDGYSIEELCPVPGEESQEIHGKSKHLLRGSIFGSSLQKSRASRITNPGHGMGQVVSPVGDLVPITRLGSTDFSSGTTTSLGETQNTDENIENTSKSCMWPNALQYSLLQTVVEACQKKKHCKFQGSPHYYGQGASGVGDTSGSSSYHSSTVSTNSIGSDPCPKRRKIVEIAYKCRPYEFRSKVACHNDVAQLECNPYSRIAIYSASFGRTEYESIQCPQPQGVREETCLASYATETVMQICHGRRRCNLAADANTFGSPCQRNSRMYLKVVYTCVPMQVLKEHDSSETEADELEDFEGDINDLYDDELNYKESEAIPKLYSNTTGPIRRNVTIGNIGSFKLGNQTMMNSSLVADINGSGGNPVMTHSADFSLEDDQEQFYIYLIIVGSLGVCFSIVIVATRLVLQKRNGSPTNTHISSPNKHGDNSIVIAEETTIPSGFNDTISEIDADIDLTTPLPLPIVSKNEVGWFFSPMYLPSKPIKPMQNYLTYSPTNNLFTNLAPNQLSTIGNSGPGSGLITTPLLVGPCQSPDLIGISPSAFVATSNGNCQSAVAGILAPAIVIGSNASGAAIPGSSAISTMLPITSLAQYTTAPTVRGGYVVNAGLLHQGNNVPTPPLGGGSPAHPKPALSPLNTTPLGHMMTLSGTSTLRRAKPYMQLSYDGTAPRTLSTGVAVSSQFYYG
ncbi:hypothetical protein KR018_004272, partial [Drosophila ironensis]